MAWTREEARNAYRVLVLKMIRRLRRRWIVMTEDCITWQALLPED
jgi:hypothetical protein